MLTQILSLAADSSDGHSLRFLAGTAPFIMAVLIVAILAPTWYFLAKKRLEHRQIMAAIEKGTPLSEIMLVKQKKNELDWIKSLTTGVAFLLMGTGMTIVSLISFFYFTTDEDTGFGLSIASMVLLAIGTAAIMRGILQKKALKAL